MAIYALHIKEHELEVDVFMIKTAADALHGWVRVENHCCCVQGCCSVLVAATHSPSLHHPPAEVQLKWLFTYICRRLVCKCTS